MKKTEIRLPALLLILLVTAFTGCRKSEDLGCSEVLPVSIPVACNDSFDQFLLRDACSLVMKDYIAQGTVRPDAFFPDSDWQPYVRMLNAVRTAIPQIQCEDLSLLTSIRCSSPNSVDELLLEVDSSLAWVDAWRNGNVLTGNPAVDSLVTKYQLNLTGFFEFSNSTAILSGNMPLNMRHLGNEFLAIPGVVGVETGIIVVDGGNIRAIHEADEVVLEFSRGYWGCDSGCPLPGNNWRFRVDENCLVQYEGFDAE